MSEVKMSESYDTKNRFQKMAEMYDQSAPYLVPNYHFLQDEVFRIIPFDVYDTLRIVDLGAGSGIFIEKFLGRFPNAKAYWIDSSSAFETVARNRLSKFNDRVEYLNITFTDKWEDRLDADPDFVFSMSAIHHLTAEGKKELYSRVYKALASGGWFINIDEMKTLNKDAYYRSLLFWAEHSDDMEGHLPLNISEHYEEWKTHFDQWKKRNIDEFERDKTAELGDDLHDSFFDQVNWLDDIGFEQADVFIKYHLWCMIGGWKGESIIPEL